MGRPKGLRKGPDGKWYMPEQEQAMLAEVSTLKVQAPAYVRKQEQCYKRNDLVSTPEGTGLVLGYEGSKVIVQLLDGTTRVSVDESGLLPNHKRN